MYKRCEAMMEAGIENPESRDGIDFCLNCPYPRCVVFEAGARPNTIKRLRNQELARKMKASGLKTKDIAEQLNKCVRTIERYLTDGYLD